MTGIWLRVCILMMLSGMLLALLGDSRFLEQMFKAKCYLFLAVKFLPGILAPGVIILIDSVRRMFQPNCKSPLKLTNAEQIRLGLFFVIAVLAIPCAFLFFLWNFEETTYWLRGIDAGHFLCSHSNKSAVLLFMLKLTALSLAALPPVLYLTAMFCAFRSFFYRPLTLLSRWHFDSSTLYYVSICTLVASIFFEDIALRYYCVLDSEDCTGFY